MCIFFFFGAWRRLTWLTCLLIFANWKRLSKTDRQIEQLACLKPQGIVGSTAHLVTREAFFSCMEEAYIYINHCQSQASRQP